MDSAADGTAASGVGRVRRHVIVSGMVQGVFFRDSCRRRARERGVAGWVRNRPDGTVEAVLEGDEGSVGTVLAWMREGPRYARVDHVQTWGEEAQGLVGFEVD